MAQYLIIGKSKNLQQIFILENGHFCERRLARGQKLVISEDQMNFHLRRLAIRKGIQIVELEDDQPEKVVEIKSTIVLDEETEFVEPIEQTPAVKITEIDEEAPEPKKKKPRRRAKKLETTEE